MSISTLSKITVPLDSNQSASNQGLLMPKLQYRFRVSLENFGVSTPTTELTKQVVDITRPNLTFETTTIDVYNSKVYLAGKHTWETVRHPHHPLFPVPARATRSPPGFGCTLGINSSPSRTRHTRFGRLSARAVRYIDCIVPLCPPSSFYTCPSETATALFARIVGKCFAMPRALSRVRARGRCRCA